MKKLFFILWSLVLLASCSTDEPMNNAPAQTPTDSQSRYLSAQEAVKKAAKAYSAFFDSAKSRSTRSGVAKIYHSPAQSREVGTDSVFYVVNFSEGGFAVVPADRNDPTDAYAIGENGYFDDSENPAVQDYMTALQGMANTIRHDSIKTIVGTIDPSLFLPEGWYLYYRDNSYAIEPVNETETFEKTVMTKWGQYYPYNIYCPLDLDINGNYVYCPTGCIAVTIAQLGGYYKIPENSIDGYGLDWAEITRKPDALLLYPNYQQQIAHLMRQAGIRAKLTYSANETEGALNDFLLALKNLGYPDAKLTTNLNMVKNHLKNYGPCAIGALERTRGNNHVWVIDGVKVRTTGQYLHPIKDIETRIPFDITMNTYIRCNWGWCGENDGYFLAEKYSYIDHRESYNGQNIQETTPQVISIDESIYHTFEYVVGLSK